MKLKKTIALMLAVITVMTALATTASAAWMTGNFPTTKSVYLYDTRSTGKIRIHTYSCVLGNHSGSCFGAGETRGKLKVTVRTLGGSYITAKNIRCPYTLTLPKGNSGYRVSLTVRQDLGSSWANFDNIGSCTHWAIETKSNTHF